jgi:hypothetical protein
MYAWKRLCSCTINYIRHDQQGGSSWLQLIAQQCKHSSFCFDVVMSAGTGGMLLSGVLASTPAHQGSAVRRARSITRRQAANCATVSMQ